MANLNRTTHNIRLHTRAQMVLLAAEQHMVAADIAQIVRTDEQTVRRWLKRYLTEHLRKNGRDPAPLRGQRGGTAISTAVGLKQWQVYRQLRERSLRRSIDETKRLAARRGPVRG